MKKIFVFIILELIAIDCFCMPPWSETLTPWIEIENSEEYKSLSQSQKKALLIRWAKESDNILKSLPGYTPAHSEELRKLVVQIQDKLLAEPINNKMDYPESFRNAVREDILNRIENENGFAEKFNSSRKKLGDDNLFRQAAYEAYAEKPEFKKLLAEAPKSSDEFLAGLKAEFEPAQNTTSQPQKEPNNPVSNNNLSPMLPFSFFITLLILSMWGLLKLKCLKPIAKFYSIQGRASRKTYWIWWFAMLPLFGLFSIFFFFLADIIFFLQSKNLSPYWGILPLWILFLAYIPYICIQIRRLHDMNLSGYWYFLVLPINHTPLVVVKWIILGCVPGSKATNKFGEPARLEVQDNTETSMPSKSGERAKRAILLDKLSRRGKSQIFISFVIGVIVGAFAVYALSNRYASYPSFKWNIVRIDRLTGKTEIASSCDPSEGWTEVKEK